MGAIAIGPLVFASDRLAAIAGVVAFIAVASFLARRGSLLSGWSTLALVVGLVAARLGHVIENWTSFAPEPWRAIAVWQGGFSPLWAILPVAAVTMWRLPTSALRLRALASIGLGLLTWNLILQTTRVSVTTLPPDIVLEQLSGPPIALAEETGRPRVINLWATWCPPCRREMPVLAEAARTRPEVTILFVNQGEGRAAIERYLASAGLSLQHVLLDEHAQVSQHYRSVGLPATLFLDRAGRVVDTHVGELSTEALREKLSRLELPS